MHGHLSRVEVAEILIWVAVSLRLLFFYTFLPVVLFSNEKFETFATLPSHIDSLSALLPLLHYSLLAVGAFHLSPFGIFLTISLVCCIGYNIMAVSSFSVMLIEIQFFFFFALFLSFLLDFYEQLAH